MIILHEIAVWFFLACLYKCTGRAIALLSALAAAAVAVGGGVDKMFKCYV